MVTHKQDLVDLVHARAVGDGTGIAVEQGTRLVSYRELSQLIGDRARELRAYGAQRTVVAIGRAKSIEFVVDFLSVLAVGGVVVPLDPDLPPALRGTFLDLARPQFLLGVAPTAIEGPHHPDIPADGAFVYFTSGSTGIPKPVLGSARGVRTFVDWFCPRFGFGSDDRFAFLAGVSFEAGLRDIFPPLSVGAALVIPTPGDTGSPEATVDWLAEAGISAVTAVPSVARGWLRHGRQKCPSVRAVFFVGEPLTTDVQAGWHTVFPGTTVQVNSYGSTEKRPGDRLPADSGR